MPELFNFVCVVFLPARTANNNYSDINNGMMYQTNVGQQAAGNGAILAHTNGGMMNTGYGSAPSQQQQQQPMQQNFPAHPDVRLRKLAFFDEIAILLKPTTLMPSSSTQRLQEGTYYFHLTPQQATDIANHRCVSVKFPSALDFFFELPLFRLCETTLKGKKNKQNGISFCTRSFIRSMQRHSKSK